MKTLRTLLAAAMLTSAIGLIGVGSSVSLAQTVTPARNCTPGYSPCIKRGNGSDVDCRNGSGNGPRYTKRGVVYRVTGSDPYYLDADNDGKGCEKH